MTVENADPLSTLLSVVTTLRDPVRGCPWDVEQDFASIVPHTIEEAYEVAETIEQNDMPALQDELGDLLFQVVFYAQIAKERGLFDFADVVRGITDKMSRRHPHVFDPNTDKLSLAQQSQAWDRHKAAERGGDHADPKGILDGIAATLPPMTRAMKLQKRAATVGFDWDNPLDVTAKIAEEAAELTHEIKAQSSTERVRDEMGDLLFACVNLARKLKIDPERALAGTNRKFERRFGFIERRLAAKGLTPAQVSLDQMERLWVQAKQEENHVPSSE